MAVVEEGQFLGHVYFGKRIPDQDVNYLMRLQELHVPSKYNRDRMSFLDCFPTEYSTFGLGDFREACLKVATKSGATAVGISYVSHRIYAGKPKLQGLPATFGGREDCTTLEVTCLDMHLNLEVILVYTAFENLDVITRSVRIKNNSREVIQLTRVLSTCIDFDKIDMDMITLHGPWGRERYINRRNVSYGGQTIASTRRKLGHQDNPFLAVMDSKATEDTGEEFTSPEVVMVYSDEGIGKVPKILHDLYRNHLIRGEYKDKKRPILINNWEATYFDFNAEKLLDIAR
jgi:alpha-galactosidase